MTTPTEKALEALEKLFKDLCEAKLNGRPMDTWEKTFITNYPTLKAAQGVDVATVQAWLQHLEKPVNTDREVIIALDVITESIKEALQSLSPATVEAPAQEARTEAEKKVLAVRGSYDAPGFDACVDAEMKAQEAREWDADSLATYCAKILIIRKAKAAETGRVLTPYEKCLEVIKALAAKGVIKVKGE